MVEVAGEVMVAGEAMVATEVAGATANVMCLKKKPMSLRKTRTS